MRLRGINFRPVATAAGTQGFFGEGYWYHFLWKWLGMTFKQCGFIAKTTTLEMRAGNMPLQADGISPQHMWPRCIVVKPVKGVVLNAVGLSGPGAKVLLDDGRLQRRDGDPFWLSFMSVQQTCEQRLGEWRKFVSLLQPYLKDFMVPVGLEMNFSCPNVRLDPAALINEAGETLDVAARLDIPLQAKFNALAPVKAVLEIAGHKACDAVTISNTIPWGELPGRIDWKGLFGSDTSPLANLGGGGLSGWPLLPIVCEWIEQARDAGLDKPIWACGGIDSAKAVRQVFQAGASGVQFGTAAMVRPWRTREIISSANELFL